jgi:hypothetical protein
MTLSTADKEQLRRIRARGALVRQIKKLTADAAELGLPLTANTLTQAMHVLAAEIVDERLTALRNQRSKS